MIIDKDVDLTQEETSSLQRESLINTNLQKPSRERVLVEPLKALDVWTYQLIEHQTKYALLRLRVRPRLQASKC
jgi:hypothetical protein